MLLPLWAAIAFIHHERWIHHTWLAVHASCAPASTLCEVERVGHAFLWIVPTCPLHSDPARRLRARSAVED